MTAKSEHTHSFEIAGFTTIEPKTRIILKQLVAKLISTNEAARSEVIEELVELVGSACDYSIHHPLYSEYAGLIIDYLLNFFLEVRCAHESEFYHFLNLLNHVPITLESPFYALVMNTMQPYMEANPGLIQLFNRLQTLYIFTEIQDFNNAEELFADLEPQVNRSLLRLWVLLQICKARLLRHKNAMADLWRMQLGLVLEIYTTDGCDCVLNFILRWILAINWHKQTIMKKALLMRIHDRIGDQKSLNGAMVLYELFRMDDRLVPSSEKLKYQKRLIKFPGTILNVKQIHSLYFFAGNYNCAVLSQFKDSILNYQYSNYYLHKCWERMLNLSSYMRKQLSPETYFSTMPYLDARIQELSNQVSLQNNAYVESLQANFDTIDSLYEKVAELSLTDSLTGLRNRRFIYDNLTQMIVLAARHHVPFCFSMIDIDFFKLTNDTYGHLAGDYILKELARIFTSDFRKSDVIVRYGGEEFLIILFDSNRERSYQIMDELRLKIQNCSFEFRNHIIPTTISIGIACDLITDTQHCDMNYCISQADKALYMAKTNGRNRVEVCSRKAEIQ